LHIDKKTKPRPSGSTKNQEAASTGLYLFGSKLIAILSAISFQTECTGHFTTACTPTHHWLEANWTSSCSTLMKVVGEIPSTVQMPYTSMLQQ